MKRSTDEGRVPHVLVRHLPTTPARTKRVAEILLDIIDHAKQLDSTATPGHGRRP